MPPVTTQEGAEAAETLLEQTRNRSDRRYPRVITFEEIKAMPRLPFARGCESGVFISRERDDARYFYQGLCFHDPDMGEYKWMQSNWDETYYCMKGVLRVKVEDDSGRSKVFDIKEGEHFYLPAGYTYTLMPSGVESINFWTLGPAFKAGLKPLKEIDIPEAPEYAKTLRAMRED
jgi:oxalate decarboxylase/phosphoglucose isomerase-like protein (cupin superfamily)